MKGTNVLISLRKAGAGLAAMTVVALGAVTAATHVANASPPPGPSTATPIKHVVVIFQENVSFDHYFGTYPRAANTSGEPFDAAKHTPTVNGLTNNPGLGGTGTLLTNNPNKDAGGHQVNPRR